MSTDTSATSAAYAVEPVNSTIQTQLNHRSIRKFIEEPLEESTLSTLYGAALQAATSSFFQQVTIVHITDPDIREKIHSASGQPYVGGTAGDLFVFVADVHRNAQIRANAGLANDVLSSASIFIQAIQDAVLAAQNMVVAAESLGLGTVFLGSINNHSRIVIEALKLPQLTYPAVGLLVGHPDQSPQLKPRLPQTFTVAENTYPESADITAELSDYDEVVTTYYDLRNANQRIDTFTHQIQQKLNVSSAERGEILDVLHEQGLLLH